VLILKRLRGFSSQKVELVEPFFLLTRGRTRPSPYETNHSENGGNTNAQLAYDLHPGFQGCLWFFLWGLLFLCAEGPTRFVPRRDEFWSWR